MDILILILIFVIIILVVLIFVLFKKNKNQEKILNEFKTNYKSITSINQQQEIELATLYERLNNLSQKEKEYKKTNIKYNEEIKDNKSLISQLQTQLEEQKKAMIDKIELLQNSEEKLKIEFKNLATEIFEKNSKSFDEKSQKNIEHILNPMKEQLTDFKKKIEDVHSKDNESRTELKMELKHLKELNKQLSTDAHNLTTALKSDNKKQGNWGEMVLEKVLENSGLREGFEFKREVSLKDDENKTFRPDVIVNLPDNRDIIIDAKTSLTAYNEYTSQEDDKLKQSYLKHHIKSIKEHIKELANKKYENLQNINSLDFIFMFVPIESALLVALDNDVNLYDEAFKQKIILVSPTTLLVALRAVENVWRYEKQAQSISDVYKRAEELYKKFYGFIDDLKKVDKGLETARTNYNEAFKKLSTGNGNLISQVTMLKKISNIKPKKELDTILVDNAINTI